MPDDVVTFAASLDSVTAEYWAVVAALGGFASAQEAQNHFETKPIWQALRESLPPEAFEAAQHAARQELEGQDRGAIVPALEGKAI